MLKPPYARWHPLYGNPGPDIDDWFRICRKGLACGHICRKPPNHELACLAGDCPRLRLYERPCGHSVCTNCHYFSVANLPPCSWCEDEAAMAIAAATKATQPQAPAETSDKGRDIFGKELAQTTAPPPVATTDKGQSSSQEELANDQPKAPVSAADKGHAKSRKRRRRKGSGKKPKHARNPKTGFSESTETAKAGDAVEWELEPMMQPQQAAVLYADLTPEPRPSLPKLILKRAPTPRPEPKPLPKRARRPPKRFCCCQDVGAECHMKGRNGGY